MGWGRHRQRQAIAVLAALDGLNQYFPAELSKQVTVGFEHRFPGGGVLRLEAYHKTGSHLRPVYRNWKGGIDAFPESNEDRILVYPDRPTPKGIELFLDRELGTRWGLQAGYSLSAVTERVGRVVNVNDPTPIVFDRTLPSPQDQRHALNLDLTYRSDRMWSMTAAYAFHTAWPATTESIVTVIDSPGQSEATIKPEKLYGSRLPSYHRLDLRITRRRRPGEVNLACSPR